MYLFSAPRELLKPFQMQYPFCLFWWEQSPNYFSFAYLLRTMGYAEKYDATTKTFIIKSQ